MWTTLLSGLFGSLSGIIGHWFKAKEKREDRLHDLEMKKLQMEIDKQNHEYAIAEIEASVKITEAQVEGELLTAEGRGFNQAVAEINKNLIPTSILERLLDGGIFARFFGTLIAIQLAQVDVIRGLVRPLLTASAFSAIGYLAYKLTPIFIEVDSVQKATILMMIIDAIVYVLTAATQFWFMDRAGARDFRKKH